MARYSSSQHWIQNLSLVRALPLAPLLACACSGDVVNVGENSAELVADAECPPPGVVDVRSQAELDVLEGCTAIDGDLLVAPFAGADLRPLHALRTVSGRLGFVTPLDDASAAASDHFGELNRTGWLALEGLESLESVGSLHLSGLAGPDLAPLANLRDLTDGDLILMECGHLRSLHGLENLRGIESLLVNCDELESVAALRLSGTLETVQLTGALLEDLGSFEVTGVVNDIAIIRTALTNLDAFSELTYAHGALNIAANPVLGNIDALARVDSLGGLVVRENPELERLPSFDALGRLNSLVISDNARLAELPPLPALNADLLLPWGGDVDGDWEERTYLGLRPDAIEVENNPMLRRFDVPQGWISGSRVIIRDNASLEHVGLGRLTRVDVLRIADNPLLTNVDLGDLLSVDALEVRDNASLDAVVFDPVATFEREMSGNGAQP